MVIMPGPGKPQVEAEYSTRQGVWEREFTKYMDNNCNKDGSQKSSNLSRSQSLGLKTLSQKVARLEVICLEADKSKKFVIVDEKSYAATDFWKSPKNMY